MILKTASKWQGAKRERRKAIDLLMTWRLKVSSSLGYADTVEGEREREEGKI